MAGKHWTKDETAAVKAGIKLYKEECPDWRSKKRDRRVALYISTLAGLEALSSREKGAIRSMFYELMPQREKRLGVKKATKRTFSPEGLKALKRNGQAQWAGIKDRLKTLGLDDDKIAWAFSKKTVKLNATQVETLNNTFATSKRTLVEFLVHDDGQLAVFIKETSPEAKATESQTLTS